MAASIRTGWPAGKNAILSCLRAETGISAEPSLGVPNRLLRSGWCFVLDFRGVAEIAEVVKNAQRKRISLGTQSHSAGLCSEHHRRRKTARIPARIPARLPRCVLEKLRSSARGLEPQRPAARLGLIQGFLNFRFFVFFALNGQVLSQKSSE